MAGLIAYPRSSAYGGIMRQQMGTGEAVKSAERNPFVTGLSSSRASGASCHHPRKRVIQ
jgi:hypothetical protein